MLINELPFVILNVENKTEYFSALRSTRENKDLDIFRNFIEKKYYNQLNSELELLQKNNKNIFLSF